MTFHKGERCGGMEERCTIEQISMDRSSTQKLPWDSSVNSIIIPKEGPEVTELKSSDEYWKQLNAT